MPSKTLTCGGKHTVSVDSKGALWSFGQNDYGQTGKDINDPKISLVVLRTRISEVTCGRNHTLCLTREGRVWAFGNNKVGECGFGRSNVCIKTPREHSSLSNIAAISCGDRCSMCVNASGEVFAFGNNENGNLGLGDYLHRYTPTKLTAINEIAVVANGISHTVFLNYSGHLYTCGNNDWKQMGFSDINQSSTTPKLLSSIGFREIASKSFHSICLGNDGKIYYFGKMTHSSFSVEFTEIETRFKVASIFCGNTYLAVIDEEGFVWTCGWNAVDDYGNLPPFVQFQNDILSARLIGCGEEHLVIKTDEKTFGVSKGNAESQGFPSGFNLGPTELPEVYNHSIGLSMNTFAHVKSARK